MYILNEFCKKRKIPNKIRDSFITYCKSTVSEAYNIGKGETTTGILLNIKEDEIERMWLNFISELRQSLEEDSPASHSNA